MVNESEHTLFRRRKTGGCNMVCGGSLCAFGAQTMQPNAIGVEYEPKGVVKSFDRNLVSPLRFGRGCVAITDWKDQPVIALVNIHPEGM